MLRNPSFSNFFASQALPEGTDRVLIGYAVAGIILLRLAHGPQEMDAEMAVEIVVLDRARHMGHVMGGSDRPAAVRQFDIYRLLAPGILSSEGLQHARRVLRRAGFGVAVPAAGVNPQIPSLPGGGFIDIKNLAGKFGASFETIDLSDLQFRCAGSVEYVDWVEGLFTVSPANNVELWKDLFSVKVFDTTHEMEACLRSEQSNGRTVRLLSSYTVPWISKNSLDAMHTKGDVNFDFNFENGDGTVFRRHWNNPERMDIFVQAPPHTMMHDDPLCEVGCPYEIRGFDIDYVGLLWLEDIVWRDGQWMVDMSRTLDGANKHSSSRARKEQIALRQKKGYRGRQAMTIPLIPLNVNAEDMPHTHRFFQHVVQAYRILLTRAVRGVFIYIRDPETRAHVRELLYV